MSEPGQRAFGEDIAPVYSLLVNDTLLCADISHYVDGVSFENTTDMADKFQMKIANPYFSLTDDRNWISHKALQPGNEIEVWAGWGRADHFLGRAIIQRHNPVFPMEEMPTLTIKGYDKSYLMMKVAGDIKGARGWKINLAEPAPADDADNQGVSWTDIKHSDVVKIQAEKYGMSTDIDDTGKLDTVIQKKGMSDWKLIKGLANLNGMELWVDWDYITKRWVLHLKRPNDEAASEYTFVYQDGDNTTLLSAEVEYGITEAITTLQVLAWDWINDKWITAVEIEGAESADPIFKPGPAPRGLEGLEGEPATLNTVIQNAGSFRLSAAGAAIDVVPEHQFKDAESLARFAQQWFLERRDNFMIIKGRTIGVETLRARQVHTLTNLSKRLDGDFYFISVTHKLGGGSGYYCEFTARKILTG
jgi:phage protein D